MTNDDTTFKGLIHVNVKGVQFALQKTITLTKKSKKGKYKWEKFCIEFGMSPQNFKTPIKTIFTSKVIMFEETLEHKHQHHLFWNAKDYQIITKSFKGPSVGYYKGNHIMFEPYSHGLCYEPILWSLVVA